MTGSDFSSLPLEQLYVQLQSSDEGLAPGIAEKRIKEQEIFFKKKSRFAKEFRLLIRQFTNPLMLLLIIAVVLSSILGASSDAIIIAFILLITVVLGFWQELKAGRALEQLQRLIEVKHTIIRQGLRLEVPVQQIVSGDVVLLDAGDIIPADCRIIDSNELHVNESSITGESYPVEKMPGQTDDSLPLNGKYNCLWQGTSVISGTAQALVVQTGAQTLFGQMASSLGRVSETAFEKGIKRFGFFLLQITIVLSLLILIVNLYFKKPFFDSVLFSLALAIGMAPELLPAIMTFSMTAGAKRMLKKKVIVKKLSSIFNLGEVTVLCTDKTGTITDGRVTVRSITDSEGKTSQWLYQLAWLNSTLQNGFSNPIDEAIATLNIGKNGYEKTDEIPYDFIRKRLSVAVAKDQQFFFITKGAFDNIISICSYIQYDNGELHTITKEELQRLENIFADYGNQGYRVLGLSYKKMQSGKIKREDEQQMVFLGFILLDDPLKESTVQSIERLEQLNIHIKIITGDNRFAASHVAEKLHIDKTSVVTGKEIDHLSPEALSVRAKHTKIFAEIEPRQKERIIKALQKSNMTVAYMGDGINDVAAINAADVGISTDNAVDVAKEAADFVLLEKNLSVLADGIYEGRKSFANSMKYIFITTGATFGNMFSVAGASLFLPFLPMLPKQILLTNLITDFPFLTIASDHVDSEQLIKPGKWNLKLIRRFMIVFGLHSSLFDFITFFVLYFNFHFTGSTFQTGWFLESVITELLILYIIRTKKSFLKSRPGKWLIVTGIVALGITVCLPFSPFATLLGFSVAGIPEIIAILTILVIYFISADILKIIFFKINEKRK